MGTRPEKAASRDRHVQFRLPALARRRRHRHTRAGTQRQRHDLAAGHRLGFDAMHRRQRPDRRLRAAAAGALTPTTDPYAAPARLASTATGSPPLPGPSGTVMTPSTTFRPPN